MSRDALEDAVREAVVTGAYAKAQALLPEYCARVGSPAEAERARRFLLWARSLVLASRAPLVDQLRRLPVRSGYITASSDRKRTWRMDA